MWTYYVEVHSFSWHRTGDNDKDHPQEKEIQKKKNGCLRKPYE